MTRCSVSVFVFVFALVAASGSAACQVPEFVSFSGRLTDGTGWGQTVTVTLTISAWDASTGGKRLWERTFPDPQIPAEQPVVVQDGYFSILLGDGHNAAGDPVKIAHVFADHDKVWIGVALEGGQELKPRQPVASVPYAVRARSCDSQLLLPPGETANLGWFRDAGTVTIAASDGSALSEDNPGWVSVPSHKLPGTWVDLKVTSNVTFFDAGAGDSSHLKGWTFGVTPGVPWAASMPVFIYALNWNDTSEGLVFAVSRRVSAKFVGPVKNLGDKTTLPQHYGQFNVFLMSAVELANYESATVSMVGATTMSKETVVDDWAFGSEPGFGRPAVDNICQRQYTLPPGQNGATPGKYFLDNGGTAPGPWEDELAQYSVRRTGHIEVWFRGIGGNAGGEGDVEIKFASPYSSGFTDFRSLDGEGWILYENGDPFVGLGFKTEVPPKSPFVRFRPFYGTASIPNSKFSLDVNFGIVFHARYRAF